jgi:hypothetical protein
MKNGELSRLARLAGIFPGRWSAAFCFFCLLLAAYRSPLGATLTGGDTGITTLSTASGGIISDYGGTDGVEITAVYIGGLTDSGPLLTFGNGNLSLTTGGTPPLVTFETAKNDLSLAHAYPVPFKPSAGHTKITFTDLTGYARIRIYTLSGELVRTLSKADSDDTLDWNVRNTRGAEVDSGVYLYIIEGAGTPKKGKLMVIR